MARSEILVHLERVDNLAREIQQFVPQSQIVTIDFRADLAGLLIVSIVSTYESCVKETLVNYANRHNSAFGQFCTRNFEKLNSRIAIKDLHSYAKNFDPSINVKFKEQLKENGKRLDKRTGIDIEKSYVQLLAWRHAFAHAGTRNATMEEALRMHLFAKRVIYAFNSSFD